LFGSGDEPPDHTEEILLRHLDRDFITYPLGEGAVTRQMVAKIGSSRGVRYPPEFVSHVCGRFPGALVEAKEHVWPRPRAMQVGPFWTFLYAVHSFTPLSTSEEWMRLDDVAEAFQAQSGLRAAPILKLEGDPNVYCVDELGAIFQYEYELNSLEPVGLGFWELFEREIAELVARKNELVAGRQDET
jgi:hypothetical protein